MIKPLMQVGLVQECGYWLLVGAGGGAAGDGGHAPAPGVDRGGGDGARPIPAQYLMDRAPKILSQKGVLWI